MRQCNKLHDRTKNYCYEWKAHSSRVGLRSVSGEIGEDMIRGLQNCYISCWQNAWSSREPKVAAYLLSLAVASIPPRDRAHSTQKKRISLTPIVSMWNFFYEKVWTALRIQPIVYHETLIIRQVHSIFISKSCQKFLHEHDAQAYNVHAL